MGYFNSANVDVFPCVGRTIDSKRSARLVSEQMLTSLVNKLLNNDSFVIGITDTEIEFNLFGYYFKLTDETGIRDSLVAASKVNGVNGTGEVYASINIVNTDGFAQINGQDDKNTKYTGLEIGNAPISSTTENWKNLLLLKKIGDKWEVPQDSEIRYTINGGILE